MKSQTIRRGIASALLALSLSACGKESAVTLDPATLIAARQGIIGAMMLIAGKPGTPSALLGAYASSVMLYAWADTYKSAMDGIHAQIGLFVSTQEQQNATFALIEDLGSALEVDIPDMLNRSESRERALETYTDALQELLSAGKLRQEELEQQMDALDDEARTASRATSKTKSDLSKALREKDYTTAGSKQEELVQLQAVESKVDAERDQLKGQIKLLDDLVELGSRRWTAVMQNREIILAGLKVVDMPGIDELGVIRDETREEKRDREKGTSVFGEI